jgi:hypothetical protein
MTWFLAANLPGVTTTDNLELACRLVEAVHAQNTRAGSDRTYHLVVSLHPEDRSIDRKRALAQAHPLPIAVRPPLVS